MKKIIVEMLDMNGYWQILDVNGVPWSTSISSSTEFPHKEVDTQDKIKALLKLKDAGFSAEDILELRKADLI